MKRIAYLLFLISMVACKEKYDSPVVSPATGYLVVEGVINSGVGDTDIFLTRTEDLKTRETRFELDAIVKVESENNISWLLSEAKEGHYTVSDLNLDTSQKYRLSIETKAGETYQSDFLEVRKNPPIDSIGWKREEEGVYLNVETHEPTGEARYYRWDYKETWERFSDYKRRLEYNITRYQGINYYEVVYRPSDNGSTLNFDSTMYYCWQEFASDKILIGNTAKLSEDKINFELAFVPQSSVKMNALYSINVKQYSMDKEAYEFLEIMKKNSELTGSIFDAQPAILYGNIHNVNNPDEPVIGYITVCRVQEKRIFIKKTEISNWRYFSTCSTTTFENNSNIIRDRAINGYIPTVVVEPPPVLWPGVPSFFSAPPECVNCNINGSNVVPDFWPDGFYYE